MSRLRVVKVRRSRDVGALGLPDEPRSAAPDAPVAEHVHAAIDRWLRVIVKREPGVRRGKDAEELHKMRVAVRRLRAVLRAARPLLKGSEHKALRDDLKTVGRVLGPVRDMDVLLARLDEQALPPAERLAIEALMGDIEAERTIARQRITALFDSKRYDELLHRLARFTPSSTSDSDALVSLVRKQFSKLADAVDEAGEDPEDDVLHALRIQGKRLRYTADLAKPLVGKPMRKLIKATKAFQDVLGEHQDACVAEDRVRELLAARKRVDVDMAFAAGRLVEREQLRKAENRAQWLSAWTEVQARAI
ncbi:CHAD domain-containing protein [Allokutzneria sp. A3M-2-11 16]|uniref:CHAD domain-containing protein n=1 Tax=Allokutzneria sp. A3M-2-11 16 TaxID=2962043 RepID=UPI0020B7C3E8|nr:CHAD domain-containing protein [Allokutzneria sp. A3M-2-11 16]MCP3798630.1 CHAD domain-containing protein [Allokutzneria sp. A3M-2-11 16]